MAETLRCWRCGEGLAALPLPLGRLDECPACRVHLHVCRMCRNYDPSVTKACTEDDAEEVRDKTGANFCDWFRPDPDAFDPKFGRADAQAREQLDRLFGGGDDGAESDDNEDPANPAEDLFR